MGDSVKAAAARATFRQGKRFHWSAFSSTTRDFVVAADFADGGGLVFRIHLLSSNSRARDIQSISAIACEEEILLEPNFKMFCTGIGSENGVEVIDLFEEQDAD